MWPKTKYQLFLTKIVVKLMASAFLNTLIFNNYIINYGTICLLLSKESHFPPFPDTKLCFAIKTASHQDKQLTPLESWDQDGFYEHGIGVSSSNHTARNFTTIRHSNKGEYLDRLIFEYFCQDKHLSNYLGS